MISRERVRQHWLRAVKQVKTNKPKTPNFGTRIGAVFRCFPYPNKKKTTWKQLRNDGPSKMSRFKNYPNLPAEEGTLHECSVLLNKKATVAHPSSAELPASSMTLVLNAINEKCGAMECHFRLMNLNFNDKNCLLSCLWEILKISLQYTKNSMKNYSFKNYYFPTRDLLNSRQKLLMNCFS